MKLSKHSKQRLKERTDIKKRGFENFYRLALTKGLSLKEAKRDKYDKVVIDYLERRSKKGNVKIYNGFTFIHSKNSKQLYTVYKCVDNVWDSIKRHKK